MGVIIVGMFSKYSMTTAAAALLLSAAPAYAADLGGDCCADLEERVATLEATTARKGNRKVSLTISGHINETLTIWDDGVDSDAYVATNTDADSRFRFAGNAKINSDWSAGYLIELGLSTANNHTVTQANDDAGSGLYIRKSEMYIKSESLGQITWGQGSPATDDLAFYGQVGLSAAVFQPDAYAGRGLLFNRANNTATAVSVGTLASGWDTARDNRIRYDTPTIAGFVLSASWGEDDFYDVSLKYAGEIGEFKVKGAVGYAVDDDDQAVGNGTAESLILTGGIMHAPTGLFVHAMYRDYDYDTARPSSDAWQVQAGIKQKWNTLGATTLFGAYEEFDDSGATVAGVSSSLERTSLGIVQDIDAAAMSLYVTYDHYEGEISTEATGLQDIDVVTVGGIIKF